MMTTSSDKDTEFQFKVFNLIYTARHLARVVMTMDEVPEGQLSKYAFYLMASKSNSDAAKVVRTVVKGWGAEQHKTVVSAAVEVLTEPTDAAATAAIESYGSPEIPEGHVVAFARGYVLNARFAYHGTGESLAYVQSDDDAQAEVAAMVSAWASSTPPPRKKFLGLF